jgi:hypothetical protein
MTTMSERLISPHCKIFVETLLEKGIPKQHIRVNNLGANEGCVVDIADPKGLEGTSIKIDGRGRPFGEIMVPHCKTDAFGQMYLVTVGMELCGGDQSKGIKGCEIDQVHVHSYGSAPGGLIGSTHVHFNCDDLDKHPSQKYCVEKLAEAIVKLDRYSSKICT